MVEKVLSSESTFDRVLVERTIGGVHEALLNRIKGLTSLSPDTPILDIGSGTGAWLDRLAAFGFRSLHGVDRDMRSVRDQMGDLFRSQPRYGAGSRSFSAIASSDSSPPSKSSNIWKIREGCFFMLPGTCLTMACLS